MSLVEELNRLHASYVRAIEIAVDADEIDFADELAALYDAEAFTLIAEREGRKHISVPQRSDSTLRRLVRELVA